MTTFQDYKYARPDLTDAKEQFTQLYTDFDQAQSVEEQIQIIDKINALRNKIDSMFNLAYVRASINTKDAFYEKERDFFDDNNGEIVYFESLYYNALNRSQFKDELKAVYGEQLFDLAELYVKQFDESIKDLLNKENKISSEYSKLVASAEIEYKGETYTFAQMGKFLESSDREERKSATLAVQNYRAGLMDQYDDIYDRLVKVRHEIAVKLGFDNFIELGYVRMRRVDYTPDMVQNYREQIKTHVVPLAQKLYQAQAERIGVDRLKVYDEPILFTDGNESPKDDAQTILENGRKMYRELSSETDEFYQFMMERELFDVEAKKGKQAGGYCTFIDDYKSPFIFSNFNGTDHDITVLTHEAGHAFQVYRSRELSVPDYLWPTHESCEIHSMSMEFFTYKWMDLFFNNADKFKYKHIGDAIQFLPYGVAVDEFQHIVYGNPEMTPKERREAWQSLEAKYLPHKDYDGIAPLIDGALWHRQGHIFESPFYYIDYTLAQVCAFQFFKRSSEDFEGAWKDYLHICDIGGSLPFNKIVEAAHLKSPFKDGTLKDVMAFLEDYLEQIDTSKF
ncbi:M3 family oligoendopeptidase [Macrococcoides bohemicum]|uniref:M3 family oligoendopeptidase n=1 Tax=Macrococcoides bohemicum TaxID=1903056 RepID=UPI000BB53AC7|nr:MULTISPECIES: M3 family oligoendopeptidase [Macrococcus]ATD29679.1 oligoendopeptidase F [Macrococcus sp. IME1552]QRN50625.1 M3 family oligoendopeptidase [Macrococcus bohemicus]